MITVTLREILSDEYDEPDYGSTVYVIRDGETVFYVGRTIDHIANRLWRHLVLPISKGAQVWGGSRLGRLIHANAPESTSCQVNILPGADEVATIRKLRPCLNVTYNKRPSELPSQYRKSPEFDPTYRTEHPAEDLIDYGVS